MLKITYIAERPRTISRSGYNRWKPLTKTYELFGEKKDTCRSPQDFSQLWRDLRENPK